MKLCLIVVDDQSYHRCVVSKLDDGVGVVLGHGVMAEQVVPEGTKQRSPLRGPVLMVSVGDVLLPTLTT